MNMFEIIIKGNKILLKGRFDATRENYAKQMFQQIKDSAIIDFKHLEYISSCGLGVLLGTQKRLKDTGQKLKLINMNDHIRDIFRYAGFDLIFEIE